MSRYFPIKTDTACQLKWTWSTVTLYSGKTNSCHRVGATDIDLDNFNQFHNTEKKLADRKLMLDGQWPSGGCEYCKDVENSGGKSDRQFQLQIPDLTPPELDADPSAISVTPRIIEVYLDNVCNMSCIYCHDGFSSRIQKENERFGSFEKGGIKIKNSTSQIPNFDQMTEKFWDWMERNYHHLRRFHVLGGEPFFQKSFERCLKFLETNSNPELEFNIISNLKVNRSKLESYIDRIKKILLERRIKRFDLTCSIDCWGQEQEYIRHGINLSEWQENFDYVAKQKWIHLNVNQTITGLGIKSMPGLINFINLYKKQRPIGHYFMSCVNRPHLYPGIFGKGFFDDDIKNVLSLMQENTWQEKNAKQLMQGLLMEWNTHQRNDEKIKDLVIFLDEIDRRRGLNWQYTFPWLAKEIDNVV